MRFDRDDIVVAVDPFIVGIDSGATMRATP